MDSQAQAARIFDCGVRILVSQFHTIHKLKHASYCRSTDSVRSAIKCITLLIMINIL